MAEAFSQSPESVLDWSADWLDLCIAFLLSKGGKK